MEVRDPDKMRRARKNKRFTQRELGMLVRRTQTTIYKIENGQLKNISEDLAIALAARLGKDWEDLFVAHEDVATPVTSAVSTDNHKVPA
ncbi:helix-turn-helix transcriptional regulator [Williamsia sp.]|uniref:helix-turn-helix transcriptional regulator n=1 Tax=Williamsia sp. TaxID=1872085 RepID=UPI002F91F228